MLEARELSRRAAAIGDAELQAQFLAASRSTQVLSLALEEFREQAKYNDNKQARLLLGLRVFEFLLANPEVYHGFKTVHLEDEQIAKLNVQVYRDVADEDKPIVIPTKFDVIFRNDLSRGRLTSIRKVGYTGRINAFSIYVDPFQRQKPFGTIEALPTDRKFGGDREISEGKTITQPPFYKLEQVAYYVMRTLGSNPTVLK